MAITRDTFLSWSGGNATITYNYNVGSGSNRLLLVGVTDVVGDNVTSVTYAGVSMTQLVKRASSGGGEMYIYGLIAPATGGNNVVIQASNDFCYYVTISYFGVKQTGLPDATSNGSFSGTSITGTVTTVANNAGAIMVAIDNNAGTASAGANATMVDSDSGARVLFESSPLSITPAGSFAMTGNMPNGNLSQVQVSFAPAPSTATNGGFLINFL